MVTRLRTTAFTFVAFLTVFIARAADPEVPPIAVVLRSESAEPTLEALQQALVEELAMPVVSANAPNPKVARGVLTVTYRARTKELVVSYSDRTRGTVTRVVAAPERAEDVSDVAALVAGNLIRDQASELLGLSVPAPLLPPSPAPATFAPASPPPPSPSETPPPDRPAPATHWLGNASLFYPLATNVNHPELETNFDFNLLYGQIGGLNGLQVGTVSTVSGDAQGLQASLVTNLVGGRVRAGQFSFLFNRGRTVEGVQVAVMNSADDAMQGLQVGGLNLAGSLSKGLQLSSMNLAGNLEGVQIGLVNIGKRVRGVQLGLINVSDDVEGVPIGLVSVSKTGGVHPVVWSSSTTYANLGVKFATRYTYTLVSGAMHDDDNHALYGGGLAIGTSIPVAKKIATEIDIQALHLFANARSVCDSAPEAPTDGSGETAPYNLPYNLPMAEGADAAGCTSGFGAAYYPRPGVTETAFTSAHARPDDQSLGKLRALLRFELYTHLSLFVGTGVTGQVTYPVRDGDTVVTFRLLSEFFGGVQL